MFQAFPVNFDLTELIKNGQFVASLIFTTKLNYVFLQT